jgi:hypothetical protein
MKDDRVVFNADSVYQTALALDKSGDLSSSISGQVGSLLMDSEFLESLVYAPLTGVAMAAQIPLMSQVWGRQAQQMKTFATVGFAAVKAFRLVDQSLKLGIDAQTLTDGIGNLLWLGAGVAGMTVLPGVNLGDALNSAGNSQSGGIAGLDDQQYENCVKTILLFMVSGGQNLGSSWDLADLGAGILQNLTKEVDDRLGGIISSGRGSIFTKFGSQVQMVELLNASGKNCLSVQVNPGDPPSISVVLPSTGAEASASNWAQNFQAILGESSIVNNLSQILESEITKLGVSDLKSVPIMISGFSQGGLLAGLFAQNFGDKFQVDQLLTYGSPIGRYEIPKSTQVTAFEFDNDFIAKLDGRDNPAEMQTIVMTGSGELSVPQLFEEKIEYGGHNLTRYVQASVDYDSIDTQNLLRFNSTDSTQTHYYQLISEPESE